MTAPALYRIDVAFDSAQAMARALRVRNWSGWRNNSLRVIRCLATINQPFYFHGQNIRKLGFCGFRSCDNRLHQVLRKNFVTQEFDYVQALPSCYRLQESAVILNLGQGYF